jgi:hypothetical protein
METIEVLVGRAITAGKEVVDSMVLRVGNDATVPVTELRRGDEVTALVTELRIGKKVTVCVTEARIGAEVTELRIGNEVTVCVTEPRMGNEVAVAITESSAGKDETLVPTELRSGSEATVPVTESTTDVVVLVTVELTVDGSARVGASGSMLVTAGTVAATGTVLLFVVEVVEVTLLLTIAGLAETILAS